MLVIADASPLIALAATNNLDLLQDLFGEVIITDEVRSEVHAQLPEWIRVSTDYNRFEAEKLMEHLDPGESTAIALALEHSDSLLIIDEKKGRKKAKSLGINITGLLGIVLAAKEDGLIDFGKPLLDAFEQHGIWLSAKLKSQVLEKLGE